MKKNNGKINFLLKTVIYFVTFVILFFVGTGIGFMVGGGNFFQAFNWDNWQHLLDFLKR